MMLPNEILNYATARPESELTRARELASAIRLLAYAVVLLGGAVLTGLGTVAREELATIPGAVLVVLGIVMLVLSLLDRPG